MEAIMNLKIGFSMDWKFGIITRDVYRVSENKFEISEVSGGTWYVAKVSKETMQKVLNGEIHLSELKWR